MNLKKNSTSKQKISAISEKDVVIFRKDCGKQFHSQLFCFLFILIDLDLILKASL